MSIVEKLNELVDKSEFAPIEKMQAGRFLHQSDNLLKLDRDQRDLVENVAGVTIKIDSIIYSGEDVIIYKVIPKDSEHWDTKYPYRYIILKNEKWSRGTNVTPDFNSCFLYYLEEKHLGLNSQFAQFAMKMLGVTYD